MHGAQRPLRVRIACRLLMNSTPALRRATRPGIGLCVLLLLGRWLIPPGFAAEMFGPSEFTIPVGATPRSVVVGDFNRDGAEDLALAIGSEFGRLGTVRILLGDGGGGFSRKADLTVGIDPRSIAVGDFNGDGAEDLAVANGGKPLGFDKVSILLGDGAGGFALTAEVP